MHEKKVSWLSRCIFREISIRDIAIATALAMFAAAYLYRHVVRGAPPEEDASMLLRYSKNFAEGHGIVWNIGDHPVEGATDFLFMITVGLLGKVVGSVITAARLILSASQIISVGALYLFSRYLFKAPIAVGLFASLYLACGSAAHLVNSVFSAPFWALFALFAWALALQMVEQGVTPRRAVLFSLMGLIVGLIRPEGNFIALYMLAAILVGQRSKRLQLTLIFALVFTVLGGAYFVWRWHYFGYLLPNPFYVKHHLQMLPLRDAFAPVGEVLLPLLALLGSGFATHRGRKLLLQLLIIVVPFTLMWAFILQANNGVHRFQYVLIPIVLLSLSGMLTELYMTALPSLTSNNNLQRGLYGLALTAALVAIFYSKTFDEGLYVNPGAYALAMRLQPLASKSYSLVSTEAGTLPFFSEWRSVDALGLNDSYLAHSRGQLSEEYLDRYKPQLILYKAWNLGPIAPLSASEQVLAEDDFGRRVPQVGAVLRNYAIKHHYTLAAVYASQYCDFHYVWTRSDGPDAAFILSAVRDHPYGYQGTGLPAFDFRTQDLTAHDTCKPNAGA